MAKISQEILLMAVALAVKLSVHHIEATLQLEYIIIKSHIDREHGGIGAHLFSVDDQTE